MKTYSYHNVLTDTFNIYEPGDLITPLSNRSGLDVGKVYEVVRCTEPLYPTDVPQVFVKGKSHGYDAQYVRLVTNKTGEITDENV